MTDIVERLRHWYDNANDMLPLMREAADEIEQLRRGIEEQNKEIDRLRAEKAETNNQWRLDYNACAAERDRLRAEIGGWMQRHTNMTAANDRLRAENEWLREESRLILEIANSQCAKLDAPATTEPATSSATASRS